MLWMRALLGCDLGHSLEGTHPFCEPWASRPSHTRGEPAFSPLMLPVPMT